jgi:hypothetical protein
VSSELALPPAPQLRRWAHGLVDGLNRHWWPWLALEVPLLAIVGWHSLDNIYYDTVAYLRLAQYYRAGAWDLAINGYWGPLMSWLLAPALALAHDHLVATRLVMGASALLFFCAGVRLLRGLGLPAAAVALATAVLAAFSVGWSVAFATPDLLMGGCALLGLGCDLSDGPDGAGRRPFAAGLCYGVAYLAKSVALPTALGLIVLIGLARAWSGAAPRRAVLAAGLRRGAGLALVVTPWVVVLSLHYGAPTFSTSAAIAHAVVGPGNPDRFHTLHHEFRAPDPGRLSTWEDPSRMPYPYWSPLGSVRALIYQIQLTAQNAAEVVARLSAFDGLRIGLVAAIAGFALHAGLGGALRRQRWRLAAPVVVAVVAPYLPTYPDETRYYLLAYPLLLAAALGFVLHDVVEPQGLPPRAAGRLRLAALAVVAVSFIAGLRHEVAGVVTARTDLAYRMARTIAPLIARSGPGALISVDDHSVAYFAAFLLDRPFYGDKIGPTELPEVVGSGARFLITRRATPFARALEQAPSPALERLPTDAAPDIALYRIRPAG